MGASERRTGDNASPMVEARPGGLTRAGAVRIDAIDMMRGLVIVIMVLDHVRDFFHANPGIDPTDPLRSYPALYLTRWVTHLCAPTFVFLAGVSILFQKANGKDPAHLSRFLLTRGLWLLFLEVTVVTFGFNFGEPFVFLQVIWAIGMGMIFMAALAQLSPRIVLGIGVAIVALCPLFVPMGEQSHGVAGALMVMAFGIGSIPGTPIFLAYAAIPWLGVMCLGFGLGPLFQLPPEQRGRRIALIAAAMLALFVLLRTLNGYGNPQPWHSNPDLTREAMAYFNVFKYPPSPDYVLATLGCSLLIFLGIGHVRGPIARVLLDFGRTPLFTYVCHIYIAHGLMLGVAAAMGKPQVAIGIFQRLFGSAAPEPWGFSLGVTYAIWALVIAILIPLARWFAGVKHRRRDWWLSYL